MSAVRVSHARRLILRHARVVPPRTPALLALGAACLLCCLDALEERRRELAADNGLLAGDVAWLERLADRLRAALDKQAATAAGLRSELAERERDITYACEDRDEYMRERDEAVALTGRLTTLSRECAAVDQRVIDALRAELTLARRPWWRKVWAWVTGGGA